MTRGDRTRRRPLLRTLAWALAATSLLTATTAFAASLSVASKNLTAFRTCLVTGTPNTSTADIDTYVDQSAATTNNGAAATMSVRSSNAANQRIYIRFDLTKCSPAIPATASIKIATLRLLVSTLPTACRTEDAFRVTASWTEAGITWNNQPFGTSLNNPASASRTSSINVGAAPCQNQTNNTYISGWDVAADVQAYVNGTATNYGWMVRDDVENSATARTGSFATKNANFLVAAPQLVVNYTT